MRNLVITGAVLCAIFWGISGMAQERENIVKEWHCKAECAVVDFHEGYVHRFGFVTGESQRSVMDAFMDMKRECNRLSGYENIALVKDVFYRKKVRVKRESMDENRRKRFRWEKLGLTNRSEEGFSAVKVNALLGLLYGRKAFHYRYATRQDYNYEGIGAESSWSLRKRKQDRQKAITIKVKFSSPFDKSTCNKIEVNEDAPRRYLGDDLLMG